jgi:histidine triad (HIT) family protein
LKPADPSRIATGGIFYEASAVTEYDPNNIFAKILRGEMPAHKVYEDDATFVFMDIMPRGDGHSLVIPKTPARNILDVPPEALGALFRTVQKVARASTAAFQADGVTIQQFNEPAGGQVVFHLHVHVIPRFDGVSLKPHTGQMAPSDQLAAQAQRLRAALAD